MQILPLQESTQHHKLMAAFDVQLKPYEASDTPVALSVIWKLHLEYTQQLTVERYSQILPFSIWCRGRIQIEIIVYLFF